MGRKRKRATAKKNRKRTPVNREYKDTVFRILYRDDKERQLELYNSVSGKHYTNADDLQVVTLKHAIYMGMKNDLAFLVSDELHMYEHQSTVNPNMPLRFLHYISKEYEGLAEGYRLYGRTKIRLAEPYFLVFYNGAEKYPERKILKLSDLYKAQTKKNQTLGFGENNEAETTGAVEMEEAAETAGNKNTRQNRSGESGQNVSIILEKESPFLELKVLVININPGQNEAFLRQCPTLHQYMEYVVKVRKYSEEMQLEQAVEQAVDECIREGILEEFLRKNKAEVVAMSIFEYDEKQVIDYIREEEREEGRKEGIIGTVSVLKRMGVSPQAILMNLQEEFHLSPENAKNYL